MIYSISYNSFMELIDDWDKGRYVERERYIAKYCDGYLGLDNRCDTCSVERFSSIYQVVLWLVSNELLVEDIKLMSDEEVLKRLRGFKYFITELDGIHYDSLFLFGEKV